MIFREFVFGMQLCSLMQTCDSVSLRPDAGSTVCADTIQQDSRHASGASRKAILYVYLAALACLACACLPRTQHTHTATTLTRHTHRHRGHTSELIKVSRTIGETCQLLLVRLSVHD